MFGCCWLIGSAVIAFVGYKLVSRCMAKPKRLTSQNKSVMVTGCDSGIGHKCAKRLDDLGFKVFAGCLQPDGQGASQLKSICSNRLVIVPLDITNDESVKKAVQLVEDKLPEGEKGLYGLVNNAGILVYGQYDWFAMRQAEMQINVNLLGTLRVTKNFMDLVIRRPGSRIVNVTSINGKFAYPGLSVYCATKYGLEGFTDALRYELKKHDVKVVIIQPGDFSRVTNILDQHSANLKKMLAEMSGERLERCKSEVETTIAKLEKRAATAKVDPEEAKKLFGILLSDMENALLAEKPKIRYVSAPTSFRIAFFFLTKLPGELMDKAIEKLIKRAARKA